MKKRAFLLDNLNEFGKHVAEYLPADSESQDSGSTEKKWAT